MGWRAGRTGIGGLWKVTSEVRKGKNKKEREKEGTADTELQGGRK